MTKRRSKFVISLLLMAAVMAVYSPLRNSDFLNYDDNSYLTENRQVQSGWTSEGIFWAFTTRFHGHWHPLTWLSHMTDCQLFGLKPAWHHLSSLLIHLINTVLLFLVFTRMTKSVWSSAFLAALFALHPLHVESVAWISDRKDLLCGFFYILTIWAYVLYASRPGLSRYALVVICFALGLMTKSMIISLPLVLLLLDYWPLKRFQPARAVSPRTAKIYLKLIGRPLLEKIGLIIPVGLAGLMALAAIQSEKLVSIDISGLWTTSRLLNRALIAYVGYLGKTIWPSNLIIPYPYIDSIPSWQVIGSGSLLALITLGAVLWARKKPYLIVGWLWYLITLAPVIGLIKASPSGMADRYTYLPLIGLFIIIAWGVPDLLSKARYKGFILTVSAAAILIGLISISWVQVHHWKNSVSLFTHTLSVDPDNWLAHNNLGTALARQGNYREAARHFQAAIEVRPYYSEALNNLGVVYVHQGRYREAIQKFSRAVRIWSDYGEAHFNLGGALMQEGDLQGAIRHFSRALQIAPDYEEAFYALGDAYVRQGRIKKAFDHFSKKAGRKPDFAQAHYYLGIVLMRQGKTDQAVEHFNQALEIRPDYAEVHNNLGTALLKQAKPSEAVGHFNQAIELKPDYAEAHYNLGVVQASRGNLAEASRHFEQAAAARPDYARAYYNLGLISLREKKLRQASRHFSRVIEIEPDNQPARRHLDDITRQLQKK